jgi:hypothetical protein
VNKSYHHGWGGKKSGWGDDTPPPSCACGWSEGDDYAPKTGAEKRAVVAGVEVASMMIHLHQKIARAALAVVEIAACIILLHQNRAEVAGVGRAMIFHRRAAVAVGKAVAAEAFITQLLGGSATLACSKLFPVCGSSFTSSFWC